ncbi:M48 family metalloprotease [Prosthecomicrobium sp. N25]|uniref:M48 family metalloprotease n=1 Tax=Prosthecomicrobium sp. N25 TaxID=3129254 RepID=UPI003077EDCF
MDAVTSRSAGATGAATESRDGGRRGPGRLGRAAAALGLVLLAGCSSVPGGDTLMEAATTPPATSVGLAPPSQDPEHARILLTYGGIYDDPNAARSVARAVGRLVAASDDPSQSYRITILNSPVVNAFALPSGNLYVTRGLLALANDTSEVAAVVAHEMAHVTARHAVARIRRAEAAQDMSRAVGPMLQDAETQRMAMVSTQHSLARFSQVQELEADAIGVRTLAKAGFDPFAASRFLASMARYAEYRSLRPSANNSQAKPDFLSSHPSTPERIAFAVRAAREIGAPGIGEQEREQFLQGLDGMVFGDDPSEGFVRGRSFLHKALGIQFAVPTGFVLENTSKAVLATNASGTALRFDGIAVPLSTDLGDYVKSGWINGLLPESVQGAQVGPYPAATAMATADGWTFRIAVLRKDKTTYRFILATQEPSAETDRIFKETVDSFRELSPAESARLRPLRLKLQKARPGDTPERLAESMSGVERKLDLFRVLNGLEAGDGVEPGRLVKLVAD